MTDAKHTPGPWNVGREIDCQGEVVYAALIDSAPERLIERDRLLATQAELVAALRDASEVMDAAASQLCADEYVDPAEVQATCEQLAEFAMKARAALARAEAQR